MGKGKGKGLRVRRFISRGARDIVRTKEQSGIEVDPRLASNTILNAMLGKEKDGNQAGHGAPEEPVEGG